ncbi:hypothetical protein NDU88_006478 [Pleurodeles waltl]|uniref:Uncharacterized protein n=1 Tax=Pleurodeles waltl TaxID=8319 RepID=A0AAV7N459_PLEWA|nr:hypothetical protein NDU88_006478 [Pleurodeles waltl]
MLQSGEVVDSLRCSIRHYLEQNDDGKTSIGTLWEALKAVVRGEVISLAAKENRVRRDKRETLERRVAALERSHKSTGAPRVWSELERTRLQLWGFSTCWVSC